MTVGKVITTHLVDGNPNGIRNIFISNKICNMYVIPRELMSAANENPDINLEQPALYILLGGEDDLSSMPQAYIGQTESFKGRVKSHEYEKDFWTTALVFIAKDNSLTRADVKFLEAHSIKSAKKSKTYNLSENKQDSIAPNLPPYLRDAALEFMEDVKLLTAFMGCHIFQEIMKPKSHANGSFYILKMGDCDAKAVYEKGSITVLAGSIISATANVSFKAKAKWLEMVNNLTETKGGQRILKINKTFKSPSSAAQFVYGGNLNGWTVWKNAKGEKLELVRDK